MLPLMDLCFGSFHLPRALPVRYGIDEAVPRDMAGQLLHPWAKADGGVAEARVLTS
jgi:hypothetical protein